MCTTLLNLSKKRRDGGDFTMTGRAAPRYFQPAQGKPCLLLTLTFYFKRVSIYFQNISFNIFQKAFTVSLTFKTIQPQTRRPGCAGPVWLKRNHIQSYFGQFQSYIQDKYSHIQDKYSNIQDNLRKKFGLKRTDAERDRKKRAEADRNRQK